MRLLREANEIPETGDWGIDNEHGAELARAWLEQARANEGLGIADIARVLRNTAMSGRWAGVEVGFAFEIAAAALNVRIARP